MKALGFALAALVAAAAIPAHADAPARPVAPLGWRFSGGTIPLDGELRFAVALGLARGTTVGPLRLTAEYEVAQLSGWTATDPMQPPARGTGHRAGVVARRELWGADINGGRIYLDVEAGGAAMLAFDSVAGRVLAPSAVAGIRFGCEVYAKGPSPARTMDGVFSVRLIADRDAVGMMVATGMDFGR